MIDVVQALVTIVTTLFGFEAVRRSVMAQMVNKVDVVIYQAKIRELHNQINALTTEVAVLKDRNDDHR